MAKLEKVGFQAELRGDLEKFVYLKLDHRDNTVGLAFDDCGMENEDMKWFGAEALDDLIEVLQDVRKLI